MIMIPYEDITYHDWDFYWGQSILFKRRSGVWQPVRVVGTDTDRALDSSLTLEEMNAAGYLLSFITVSDGRGEMFNATPLEPFESQDWITYEPELGYFLLNGKLLLLDCSAPRARNKGLCANRLRYNAPIDACVFPKSIRKWLTDGQPSIDVSSLALAVADRLNNGFPSKWRDSILSSINVTGEPCVLESSVALVPDKAKGMGMLLYNGVLIGNITADQGTLTFKSRGLASVSVEASVMRWVNSNIEV